MRRSAQDDDFVGVFNEQSFSEARLVAEGMDLLVELLPHRLKPLSLVLVTAGLMLAAAR